MQCTYCKNTFQNKYSLKAHQTRAKYCLDLQRKKDTVIIEDLEKCEDCKKSFSSHNFSRHVQSCKIRLQNENARLKKEIIDNEKTIATLKKSNQIYKEFSKENADTVKEIAKQPKTQNNNQNNQLLLLTPLDLNDKEKVKQIIESSFTHDHFLLGQKGVAKFAVDNLLKDDEGKLKYVCSDPSRAIFKYRSPHGDIERDVKARKLTDLISGDVIKRSTNLVNNKKEDANSDQFIILLDNYTNIRDLTDDNGEFRVELATLTTGKN